MKFFFVVEYDYEYFGNWLVMFVGDDDCEVFVVFLGFLCNECLIY